MRNRSIQLKFVKDHPATQMPDTSLPQNSLETTIVETVKGAAPTVAASFMAYKAVDALSKIALHIVATKIK